MSAILIGQTDGAYLSAAEREVRHLLDDVPRWSNGAISHRESVAELWADFVYMAPPTLAYWAVQAADAGLLREAARQCLLYRDVLIAGGDDPETRGLWHHIIGPESQDLGLWSTGNAWAAAGMTRVLATAKNSGLLDGDAGADGGQPSVLEDLASAIRGILDSAIAADAAEPDEPLLRNYIDDASWFGELSGTTLLAATAYRVAALGDAQPGYVAWADEKRRAVTNRIGDDGLLYPVINPLNWGDRTPSGESPEAQSFAVMLFAAYRDYCQGSFEACEIDFSKI